MLAVPRRHPPYSRTEGTSMKRFMTLGLLLAAATAAGSYTFVWSPTAKWGSGAVGLLNGSSDGTFPKLV